MKENKSVEAPAICFYEDENGSRVHFQFSDKAQTVVISLDEIKKLLEENERLNKYIKNLHLNSGHNWWCKSFSSDLAICNCNLSTIKRHAEENERLKAENKELMERLEKIKASIVQLIRAERKIRARLLTKRDEQIEQLKAQLQQAVRPPEEKDPNKHTLGKVWAHGIGLNYPQSPERKPQVCPVCEGRTESIGIKECDGMFYPELQKCKACNGTGVLWEPK